MRQLWVSTPPSVGLTEPNMSLGMNRTIKNITYRNYCNSMAISNYYSRYYYYYLLHNLCRTHNAAYVTTRMRIASK